MSSVDVVQDDGADVVQDEGVSAPALKYGWPTDKKRRWILIAIMAFIVVSRVGWVAHLGAVPFSNKDQRGYEQTALAIEHKGRFTEGTAADARPAYFHSPGYPIFIAAVYRVAGDHRAAVVVVQSILGALTAWFAFIIAFRLRAERAALLAAAVVAVEPLGFWAAGQILSEALTSFLLIATLLCVVELIRSKEPRWAVAWAVLCGLSLTAATFVRPTSYYLVIPLALILVYAARKHWRTTVAIGVAAAFVLPAVILCGAWQVRNVRVVDSARFSGVEGFNIYAYGAGGARGRLEGVGQGTYVSEQRDDFGPPRPGEKLGHYYDRMYAQGVDQIMAHKPQYARYYVSALVADTLGVNFTVFPYLRIKSPPGWLDDVARLSVAVMWVLSLVGFVWAWRRNRGSNAIQLVAALLVIVPVALSAGAGPNESRMRAPVMPIVCVYAAIGLYAAWHAVRSRTSSGADDPVPAAA